MRQRDGSSQIHLKLSSFFFPAPFYFAPPAFESEMGKVQLKLEAASPGGRVRKRKYDVTTTPLDESEAGRAKRKSANRSSALRARKALAQMLTEEPPPAIAPPVALELVPPSMKSTITVRLIIPFS